MQPVLPFLHSGLMVLDLLLALPLDLCVWAAAGGPRGEMTALGMDALQIVKLIKLGRMYRVYRARANLSEAAMLRGSVQVSHTTSRTRR